MRIRNRTTFVSTSRQGTLSAHLTSDAIGAHLVGVLDQGESGDGKCQHRWDFTVDGKPFAIWDYKGAKWSYYGDVATMRTIFGAEAVRSDAEDYTPSVGAA